MPKSPRVKRGSQSNRGIAHFLRQDPTCVCSTTRSAFPFLVCNFEDVLRAGARRNEFEDEFLEDLMKETGFTISKSGRIRDSVGVWDVGGYPLKTTVLERIYQRKNVQPSKIENPVDVCGWLRFCDRIRKRLLELDLALQKEAQMKKFDTLYRPGGLGYASVKSTTSVGK